MSEQDKAFTLQLVHAEIGASATYDDFENFANVAAEMQRGVNWWIGDLVIAAERQLKPSVREAIWPEWVSPDLVARCRAVAAAYPPNTRNPKASWSIHMKHANASNRVAMVAAAVEAGQTTTENRENPALPAETAQTAAVIPEPTTHRSTEPEPVAAITQTTPSQPAPPAARDKTQWLLVIDVAAGVAKRFFAGATDSAAMEFVQHSVRLVAHLKQKGLTAVVFAEDSTSSVRKDMTAEWETPYKSVRNTKDPALANQLELVATLLHERNATVVGVNGWEADDVMATYAATFPGRVTLMTADKDLRQCLQPDVNLLTDVQWERHPDTNAWVPVFSWVTEKKFVDDGTHYQSAMITGITPEQWPHFQAIAGDSSDGIAGVPGIGPKGAAALISAYGTVPAVVQAAIDGRITEVPAKKVAAIVEFAPIAETTLALTTLKTSLGIPAVNQITMVLE